jgi:superoxide reductase
MFANHIQQADWKSEKHIPVIECLDTVVSDELFEVKITLGKEIAHPNTTEHHIRWIKLYFRPRDGKFIHDVASFQFNSHGESVQGPNEGPVYTHHGGITWMKVMGPGTLYAIAYCNIHGLWESNKELNVTGAQSE